MVPGAAYPPMRENSTFVSSNKVKNSLKSGFKFLSAFKILPPQNSHGFQSLQWRLGPPVFLVPGWIVQLPDDPFPVPVFSYLQLIHYPPDGAQKPHSRIPKVAIPSRTQKPFRKLRAGLSHCHVFVTVPRCLASAGISGNRPPAFRPGATDAPPAILVV